MAALPLQGLSDHHPPAQFDMALLMNSHLPSNTGTSRLFPPEAPARGPQKGVSLFISLVTLVIITLAGIALLRSVDTGALVAGNLAFKDATMQATSIGMEEAAKIGRASCRERV